MPKPSATVDMLHEQIADADTQWSLGAFGGIAEFSRGPHEKAALTRSATGGAVVTARGGIAIDAYDGCRAFAFESITKTGWSQRVALCLPEGSCAMSRRTMLTELGADHEALKPQYRESILFDLGLGALQADFCVRIDDADMVTQLRRHSGRSVFDPANPAMGLLLQANPHRVVISRIGRIEVYQPIPPPSGTSPEGPHTHVLPKLLKSGRTHAATEPIPQGWIPCAYLYPAHPTRQGGDRAWFDAARHGSFQRMLESFGLPDGIAIKRRIIDAIQAEQPPSTLSIANDRHTHASVRIALRQMKAAGHASPILHAWLATFDRTAVGRDEEDETSLPHPH